MSPLFTILIESLEIETIIGIHDFERTRMQKVVVDCTIVYRRIEDSYIDYALVVQMIQTMLTEGKYSLIEDALTEIVDALKARYAEIETIRLKICKPDILENCTVCVEKSSKY